MIEKKTSGRAVGANGAEDAAYAGPLHGYGIARRIEQTSGDSGGHYGTRTALLKLEQERLISS